MENECRFEKADNHRRLTFRKRGIIAALSTWFVEGNADIQYKRRKDITEPVINDDNSNLASYSWNGGIC
jgi:hypothetical protein